LLSWTLENFMTLPIKCKFVEIKQKYWALYMQTPSTYYIVDIDSEM
jgi:hypothetical protein